MTFHSKRFIFLSIFIISGLFLLEKAYANSGIPGPILHLSSTFTVNPIQWIAVNMAMCIGIEGAIYHYLQLFEKPYYGSIVANTVSLFAGVPLVFLGAFDPTLFVLPTIVSIWVELMVLRNFKRKQLQEESLDTKQKKIDHPVIYSNILTNLIMIVYVIKIMVFQT